MAAVADVLPAHRFDEAALARHLAANGLPGFSGGIVVRQFRGGQSNPTYLLETPDGGERYVLRKKPPGKLLPSAHQVDREYRVMAALAATGVPVPAMRLLCDDDSIIGTAFFVMDHLDGRVVHEPSLDGDFTPAERAAIWDSMNETLAALHSVDVEAVGLGDFGRPSAYVERQVARWTKQFEAAKTDEMPAMDALIDWLPRNMPADDETAIAHGDFRLGNLMLHSSEPRVIAVLDWELSTLGHPLADLAYNCMPYRMPYEEKQLRGVLGLDLAERGIPAEEDYVAAYCRRTGRDGIPDWRFFLAFSFFRLASICQGVYARGIQGNASAPDAIEVGAKAPKLAEIGWDIASGG